jgi:NAD(P)-dependent dehydrogenase (short-subunit alcohol dehydrogenase family)
MKIIAITGATGAVGKATALELAKKGHRLILIGRNVEKLKNVEEEIRADGNSNVETFIADFTDLLSVKKVAEKIRNTHTKLDGLINVAAVYRAKRELTKDKLELMFGVNHMSVFVLTKELLPIINSTNGSRILTVSAPSFTKLNFDDLQGENKFNAFNAFGASKMANHLFTYALARRMNGISNAAMVFHPGIVKSDLIKEMPAFLRFLFGLIGKKPQKAGKAIAELLTASRFNDVNGKFFDSNFKELKQPGYSGDTDVQELLWKKSEELANQAK